MKVVVIFCFLCMCKFGEPTGSGNEGMAKTEGNLRQGNSGGSPRPPSPGTPGTHQNEPTRASGEPLIPPINAILTTHPLEHSGEPETSIPDPLMITHVPIILDIFDLDRDKVRITERTTYGIEEKTYIPASGLYFAKIREMGERIWSSGKSGKMSTSCTTYGKNGIPSLVEVTIIKKFGDLPDALYYAKNGTVWKNISTDDFYDKLGAMEERKPFKIDRSNESPTFDGKDRETIDISNINNNLVDVTLDLEGAISYIKYIPKPKVNVGSIVDGPNPIWIPEDEHTDCVFIKVFSKDETKLLLVYTHNHHFPGYEYYEKSGGRWTPIQKDEYDRIFNLMKEVHPIKYTLDLMGPDEGKFIIRDDYVNEIKERIISAKNTFTVTSIVEGSLKVWEAGAGEKLKTANYHYRGESGVMQISLDKYGLNTERFFVKRKGKWFQVMDDTYKREFEGLKKKEPKGPIFPKIIIPPNDDRVLPPNDDIALPPKAHQNGHNDPPTKPTHSDQKTPTMEDSKEHFFEHILPKLIEEEKGQEFIPKSPSKNETIMPPKNVPQKETGHFIPEPSSSEPTRPSTGEHETPKRPLIPEGTRSERGSGRDFTAEFNRARERVESRLNNLFPLELVQVDSSRVNQMIRKKDGIIEISLSPKGGKFNKVQENGVDIWIARNGESCLKAKAYTKGRVILLQLYTTIGNRVGFKSLKKSDSGWVTISEDELFMELSKMTGDIVEEKMEPEISGTIFSNPCSLIIQIAIFLYLIYFMN